VIAPSLFETAAPPAFQHHATNVDESSLVALLPPASWTVNPPSLNDDMTPLIVSSSSSVEDLKILFTPLTESKRWLLFAKDLDLIQTKSGLNSNPVIDWPVVPLPVYVTVLKCLNGLSIVV